MTTQEVLGSVVIPTCGRPDLLRACLHAVAASLARTDGRIDVVVTDDSRDDRSEALVAREFPWVRWVQGPRRGPAANRNHGVRASSGRWIFFTDDDCIPHADWLRAFVDRIRTSDCRVLEGKTVADRERQRMDEEAPVNPEGGYLWSCNLAIGRAAFDELRGFCESFPYPAMEDVDLRVRLFVRGERCEFVAGAVVCHPYRPAKGLKFALRIGASYLHLAERHPHLLGPSLWRGMLTTLLRRSAVLGRDAVRYRFRGFLPAAATTTVGCYFDVIARLRAARRPRTALANAKR